MRGPLIQQLLSIAVTVLCAVVTASHLNCAFKQTFSITRIGDVIILSKCVKSYNCQIAFFKRLTLAQCVDVRCRPTV